MSEKIRYFQLTQSGARLMLFVAVLLAFTVPRWQGLNVLDDQLFSLATRLLPVTEMPKQIVTVVLPERLLQSPDNIKKLRHALKRLKKHQASSVSLLMSQIPEMDYRLAEPTDDAMTNRDEWQLTRGELTKLAWVINQYDILLAKPVQPDVLSGLFKNRAESYFEYFQRRVFGGINYLDVKTSIKMAQEKLIPFSMAQENNHNIDLLWRDDNNQVSADLVLAIYLQVNKIKNYSWLNHKALKIDDAFIPADYKAQLKGYFSSHDVSRLASMNMDELLLTDSHKIKNKLFILGDDESSINKLALASSSMISNNIYGTPAWASWLTKLAIIFAFIYFAIVVVKLQMQTAILLNALLLFSMLVLQYAMFVVKGIWLPMISLYVFFLLAIFVMLVKKNLDNRAEAIDAVGKKCLTELAFYQFENNDHERALSNLLKCANDEKVFDALYEIALAMERRRQYDKALQVFSEIELRDAHYKDVKNRIKILSDVGASGISSDIVSPLQGAKTLIIPDLGLQLPEFGRYQIERELGRGAMGVVYLAKDPKINRPLAIKTLDYSQFSNEEIKTIKSRFFREAEAAGRLNHNEIVTVYDVGEEEGFAFIAMDYVQGVSLSDYVRPDSLLSVDKVYELIAKVAQALDYAHSQNIVHRDIKPSNIMYDAETQKIKITDFGIARIIDSVRTRTGSFMGSPSYMAPEQMVGANVTHHADIYALGVSFYQLLTGHLPFEADSIGNLAYLITNEKHKPVRDVRADLPASASRIVNKTLQKNPDDRYSSGKELADAILRGMPGNERNK